MIFVENFNDDLATIKTRWEQVQNEKNLSLSREIPNASQGKTSLQVTHTGGNDTGADLYRRLEPGYAKLHYRFYVRFAEDCAPIHHFFHVGGYNPATPWAQGGAGERPRGDKRLTTGVEPFGELWQWDYYSYWMEMRGSPPRGQCWGNSFIHDRSLQVTKGDWQCLELMMKLNDVGKSNGEMALWIDGKLVSHLRRAHRWANGYSTSFYRAKAVTAYAGTTKQANESRSSFRRKVSPLTVFAGDLMRICS